MNENYIITYNSENYEEGNNIFQLHTYVLGYLISELVYV